MAVFKIQEYANHVIIQEQDAYGRWWTISKRITLEEINLPEDNRASISASIFLSIGDINNRHNKWEITPKTTTEEKE